MKAPPSSPVALLSLLLSTSFLLFGCRHTDAIASPKIIHLPEAEAMTELSQPELLTALTRMIRGAQHVRHFSADEVATQLGYPLQSRSKGPVYFGTDIPLSDGSNFGVIGVG